MKPLVRAASLSRYVELCQTLRLDPQPLMRQVGLSAAALAVPDRWISGSAVAQLLELSAAASGREDFGLRLAELRRFSTLGPISVVLREEPDVRSALDVLVRQQRMYNEALHPRLSEAESLATLRVDLQFGEQVAARQATELAVRTFHLLLCGFIGAAWKPLSVCFGHGAPADVRPHRRVFGPVVEFDREFNGIVMYTRDLDLPNTMADPLMRTYVRRYFETIASPGDVDVVARVCEIIEALLPAGRCSIEEVARGLGVDRRTVHRYLAAQGETFSSLLDSTRAQLAEQLLANPRRSAAEASDLLGFSSPSAFSRWFRGHFGCGPKEWRARQAQLQ
jgi:AraC-like DNA-binding protein